MRVAGSLAGHGAAMMDVMVSPLLGADGNVEFLAHLTAHASEPGRVTGFESAVAEALALQGT